jgi:response regulator RpfG family c-di-GMP phosphodiesterase
VDTSWSELSLLADAVGKSTAVNRRVLVVDREASVRETIRASLCPEGQGGLASGGGLSLAGRGDRFVVDAARQGEEAVLRVEQAVREGRPYAVAFVDMDADGRWSGIETVSRLWEIDPDLHAVMCTADSAVTAASMVDRLGESDRLLILRKPFTAIEARLLASTLCEKWNSVERARVEMHNLEAWVVNSQRVLQLLQESHAALEAAHLAAKNRATKLALLVQQRTVEAIGTRDVAVLTLAKLAESRDPETGLHLERMRGYTQILAEYLGRTGPYADQVDGRFLEDLLRASPMHDIGKVGIPDEILLKPGPLTREEFEVMKQHAAIGSDALRQVAEQSDYANFLHMAAEIARSHHEHWDGRGYPDGLRGQEIPLSARIVALADVFDAMTSVRVYKDAFEPEQARRMIEEEEVGHFDPVVLDAFRTCYGEFLEVYETIHDTPPVTCSG